MLQQVQGRMLQNYLKENYKRRFPRRTFGTKILELLKVIKNILKK